MGLSRRSSAAVWAAMMVGLTPLSLCFAQPVRDITDDKVNEQQLRSAIASRTLTWLTGTPANNDYVSVGRIANFFGFVALRVSSGQSLSRSDVGSDTLAVLDDDQRQTLIDLTDDQRPALEATRVARVTINRALEGLLVGETVSRDEFLRLGEDYGAAEAELGRVIAQTLGQVAGQLTPSQQQQLASIRVAYISGNGASIDLPKPDIRLPQPEKVDLINSAARLLSWVTGTPEDNDFEVVGKPSQHFGFVSLRTASNHGVRRGAVAREVREMLTPAQRKIIDTAAAYNAERFEAFLVARGKLMRVFEGALAGQTLEADTVERLGRTVGSIEGEMTWSQAEAMLEIRDTMSSEQLASLTAMRAKYTVAGGDESAAVDPAIRGRQLFGQCSLCHNPATNYAAAPRLDGVVGGKIAGDRDFEWYSVGLRAYADANKVWTPARLDAFLASPRDEVPGTSMAYKGLDAPEDRAALIAYLSELGE